MIYPNNYEHKIGFNDIKVLLSGFCQSELGRERVGELQMLTEVSSIRQKRHSTIYVLPYSAYAWRAHT